MTKVAGLTDKSSSPVETLLKIVSDVDEENVGSDVQLTECFIVWSGAIWLLFKFGKGAEMVQNETRCRFLESKGVDEEPAENNELSVLYTPDMALAVCFRSNSESNALDELRFLQSIPAAFATKGSSSCCEGA